MSEPAIHFLYPCKLHRKFERSHRIKLSLIRVCQTSESQVQNSDYWYSLMNQIVDILYGSKIPLAHKVDLVTNLMMMTVPVQATWALNAWLDDEGLPHLSSIM